MRLEYNGAWTPTKAETMEKTNEQAYETMLDLQMRSDVNWMA